MSTQAESRELTERRATWTTGNSWKAWAKWTRRAFPMPRPSSYLAAAAILAVGSAIEYILDLHVGGR